MRGSPLLRALLAFIIIALLGIPLWQLTRPGVVVAMPALQAPKPEVAKAIHLHLTFTAVPKKFTVSNLDKVIWEATTPEADMEQDVSMAYPSEGIDLQFHIEWPEDGPLSALRVQLTDPAGDMHEKSIWGKGVTDEVVTFP